MYPPIVNRHHHDPRPLTDIRAHRILRVDIAQHPAAPVKVEEDRPSAVRPRRRRLVGREHSHGNVRPCGLDARDLEVLGLADGEFGAAAGDDDAAGARGGDRLQVNLLLVSDVFVVEGGVLGMDAVADGRVEGIWGLGS